MIQDTPALLEPVLDIARQAGRAILEIYENDFEVQSKADESPLTAADLASHGVIHDGLAKLTPDVPFYSEESDGIDWATRSSWSEYWLVDPLDGTKEFINRNGEFTVNIALIQQGRPVLGVVHVPVKDADYYGCPDHGAWRRSGDGTAQAIRVAEPHAGPVRVVGSRSHRGASLDAYLEAMGPHEMVPMGSSLKFCVVAEGSADIYPRLGPTSEWDTAAAQAVVEGAGGKVVDTAGEPLGYNAKEDILNPYFLVIGGDPRDWTAYISS